jgi:hypothetical protein
MAMMGSGMATGENRARVAAESAISSPLLEDVNLSGAHGLLINVTAGMDLRTSEFHVVGDTVKQYASEDANVVVGCVIDPEMREEIRVTVVATGPDVAAERARIEATYLRHKNLRGMFAVDGGSTQGVADVMRKHRLRGRGVRAGGYDLLPRTLRSIADGHLDFTIDQQPYLQGFLPVFQLFMVKYTAGLVAPSDTNTGLHFVTRSNVRPYLTTTTRYEGSSAVSEYPVT